MFKMPAKPARRKQRRKGAALVEMALVLPIFCMVVFGIVEFGRAFMIGQLVTNAAREGVRQAVTGDYTNSQITADIKSFLLASGKINGNDVTITYTVTPAAGNPAVAGNEVSNCTSKDLISVKVSIPFSKVSLIPPTYLKTTALSGQASMRFE